jgi:hypothetical protein
MIKEDHVSFVSLNGQPLLNACPLHPYTMCNCMNAQTLQYTHPFYITPDGKIQQAEDNSTEKLKEYNAWLENKVKALEGEMHLIEKNYDLKPKQKPDSPCALLIGQYYIPTRLLLLKP